MTKHYQKARERAAWIWQQYEAKGYVTSTEIKKQFGREGRELEKELRLRGIELPLILTDREALALEQSQTLMKASCGKPMTIEEMAQALDCQKISIKGIRGELADRGLPCPKVITVYDRRKRNGRTANDTCHVSLPEYQRGQISDTHSWGLPLLYWPIIGLGPGHRCHHPTDIRPIRLPALHLGGLSIMGEPVLVVVNALHYPDPRSRLISPEQTAAVPRLALPLLWETPSAALPIAL